MYGAHMPAHMARIIPRIILLPGGLLGRVLEGFVGGFWRLSGETPGGFLYVAK